MGRNWRSPRGRSSALSLRRREPSTESSRGNLKRRERPDSAVWLENSLEFDGLRLCCLFHVKRCFEQIVRKASADVDLAVKVVFAAKTEFASRKRAGNGRWASTSALVDSQHTRRLRSVQMKLEFVTKKVPALFVVFNVGVNPKLGSCCIVAQRVRKGNGADDNCKACSATESHYAAHF